MLTYKVDPPSRGALPKDRASGGVRLADPRFYFFYFFFCLFFELTKSSVGNNWYTHNQTKSVISHS